MLCYTSWELQPEHAGRKQSRFKNIVQYRLFLFSLSRLGSNDANVFEEIDLNRLRSCGFCHRRRRCICINNLLAEKKDGRAKR